MDKKINTTSIDKSMFEFVQENGQIHDTKLDTKPIGYFKDAFIRFKKNQSSVAAFVIIVILLLFSIFGPLFTEHTTTEADGFYKLCLPTSSAFSWAGWDGCSSQTKSQDGYDLLKGINYEELEDDANNVNTSPVIRDNGASTDSLGNVTYNVYVNSYYQVGFEYLNLEAYDYLMIQAYQDANNIQIIYPMTSTYFANTNADVWYKTVDYNKEVYYQNKLDASGVFSTTAIKDENGNYIPNYMGTSNMNKADYYSNMRLKNEYSVDENNNIVGNYNYTFNKCNYNQFTNEYILGAVKTQFDNCFYQYAVQNQTGYKVRVMYYEYYKYNKTTISYEGGKAQFDIDFLAASNLTGDAKAEAMKQIISNFNVGDDGYYCTFLFGSNDKGKDIFVMLASGARLSFILAIGVSLINLTIGAIYGAIEGYYGGTADMVMERVAEILSEVPFIVVATLFNLHLAQKVGAFVSLLFAFVLTGWIGMASRTRMQFYRFKGQEYILSARTLGAKDARIMFKHIFPNAIGTLITGSVLSIPGVIFSESSLSYLKIIDLESSGFTSVGTLLSNGTAYVSTFPHIVLFPAVFISLLMISFNLLGNGLRDAFNPSLRGVDE